MMRAAYRLRRVAGVKERSQPAESRDLALDLGLDVQRWLALPCAAMVASDYEVADLGAQLAVDGRGGEPAQLRVDIQLGLAPPAPPGVAGLEHLADLLVAL
jgi:hypothetical protein